MLIYMMIILDVFWKKNRLCGAVSSTERRAL